jgi:hypothetical protein
VGFTSISWDIFGCAFSVHRHAPIFALAFAGLAVASAIVSLRSR